METIDGQLRVNYQSRFWKRKNFAFDGPGAKSSTTLMAFYENERSGIFRLKNKSLFRYLYVTCNQRNYLDTRTPEFDFRGGSCRIGLYEALFRDKVDDNVVVLVQDLMACIHDKLDEVVEVHVMRKGLKDMGPNKGEPNNQHEWFLSVEVHQRA
jgi:hypothetical protein